MHELAVMESVVDAVMARMNVLEPDERVTLVRLEIGQLAGVDPATLHFAFDVCTEMTVLDGAELEIVSIAARARCRSCGDEGAIASYVDPCARCGALDRDLLCGTELRVRDLEVV